MSLIGKVALVTGGAQGIGRAIVESLLQEGASVAICDYNKEVGEKTAQELSYFFGNRVLFFYCDVTKYHQLENSIRSTIQKLSRFDILVNNAGISNETENGWRQVIDTNVVALTEGTRLGFKYMGRNNGGRGGIIINMGSTTALEKFPVVPIYSSTKAFVNQLSRSYGDQLFFKNTGVKVIVINPGATETALSRKTLNYVWSDYDRREYVIKHYGYPRLQNPQDVGKGVIQVIKYGENGSQWTIENGEPPKRSVISSS